MKASCTHVECAKVQQATAAISSDIPGIGFVDLSFSDLSLQRQSLDCTTASTVIYMRDRSIDEWFRLQVSRVTDPELLLQLTVQAAA